jgi:hypothetical protein
MPPIIEFIVITFTMLGAFFLVFFLIFLLALALFPIERGLSNMIWSQQPNYTPVPSKGSFKDFSKKHKA